MSYRSQIKLGTRYRCKHTGFEGAATAVTFYEHGCERVSLKGLNTNGEVVEYGFDAPEVEEAATRRAINPVTNRLGGPHGTAPAVRR